MLRMTWLALVAAALLATTRAASFAAESESGDNEWRRLGAPDVPPFVHEPGAHQPPAPLRERVTSLRLSRDRLTRSGYTSVQVNVDASGDNIVGDAANEPSMAISPVNPNWIVIGWRQFDSVTSDFRQAGWAYSHDAGQSWTFPGVLTPGVFRSDPVLGADPNGNFYYCSLEDNFHCSMFKSVNGGVSWSAPVFMFGGDKQWFTIDGTASVGRGNLYASWSQGSEYTSTPFTRSRDGGQTFDGPFAMSQTVFGAMTVDPNGTVYVAGVNSPSFSNPNTRIARSLNAKTTGTPTFTTRNVPFGGSLVGSLGPNPVGLLGQMWIAADLSSGPTRGYLYALCSVQPSSGSDPLDVKFTRSTDGGNTWSTAVRVNDDPSGTNAWQWFGTLSVAPNGRIDVVWNDTRNDPRFPSYPTYSELYYAYSTNAGQTWSRNMPISPPWNHSLGYPQQQKIGDYYHMISDNVAANLAYAATFNGEQDVYFVRIGDCNHNGVHDGTDIANGTSTDFDSNGIPDDCQDCDSDGVADPLEIINGTHPDCNHNWVPDACDIAAGTSQDCNANGVPDECDLAGGFSADCNGNGIPDECDLANGSAHDCNSNGILDVCDIAAGTSVDCNSNGIPDECELADGTAHDCNGNGVLDVCDLANGTSANCNSNGVPDECDRAHCDGSPWCSDCNSNGILDACDLVGHFAATSPAYTPLGYPTVQTFTLTAPPAALGDVLLTFSAYGDLFAQFNYVNVSVNGQAVGTAYGGLGYFLCVPDQIDTLTVPMATYNALKTSGGGNVAIAMSPTSNISRTACGSSPTTIKVTVTYSMAPLSQDVNSNGIPDECEHGACCFPNGSCTAGPHAACTGTYQGDGTTCTPNPCPQPTGACCFPNGSCTLVAQANCTGTWQGDGTTCTPNPCPPALCPGDMNCDSAITFADIDLFVAALSGESAWNQAHPNCPWLNGDCNGDHNVTFADIDPFVALIGTTCP